MACSNAAAGGADVQRWWVAACARAGNVWNTLAKVEGPTCFGGCYELCSHSSFDVSRMATHQLGTALKVGDVAKIVKRKPNSMMSTLRELVTDADVYTME